MGVSGLESRQSLSRWIGATVTPPLEEHTRPLTRRQRIALGLEKYVPIEHQKKYVQKMRIIVPQLEQPVLEIKEKPKKLSLRKRLELAVKEDERREKTIAWLKNIDLEIWRQKIQEDEKKINAAGGIPYRSRQKRKHVSHTSYYAFYGPKWLKIQAKAMIRANRICERCKKSKAVHVHHKIPVRYFLDSEDAHYLENILAVCLPCHHQEHRELKENLPLLDQIKYNFSQNRKTGRRA